MGFLAPLVTDLGQAVGHVASSVAGAAAGAGRAVGSLIGKTGTTLLSASDSASTFGAAANAGAASSTGQLIGDVALQTGGTILAQKALQGPKPPAPPQPPNLASSLQRLPSLIGPNEGTSNGTFLTGTNRSGSSKQGGKALLGQ